MATSVSSGIFRQEVSNGATTGNKVMVLTTASAAFVVGETIADVSGPVMTGVVTGVWGTAPNITIQYYENGTGSFASGTGTFAGSISLATATAVNSVVSGPVFMVPANVDNLTIHGKVVGAGGAGNSLEMTFSSPEEIATETASWVAVVAALTGMSNTTYNETQMKEMGTRTVTAFRVLRANSTSVQLLALGKRKPF